MDALIQGINKLKSEGFVMAPGKKRLYTPAQKARNEACDETISLVKEVSVLEKSLQRENERLRQEIEDLERACEFWYNVCVRIREKLSVLDCVKSDE